MTQATATREDLFATDFDSLAAGDACTGERAVIAGREVELFAALTGDHHPAHVDPAWARSGPFGRPIAHGLLVLSQAVGTLPLDPERVIAVRRFRDAVFKRPVAVGEAITVRCEIVSTRPLDDSTGLVECEWRIVGDDGRLRVRALVEVLWRRGAVAEHPAEAAIPPVDETAPVVRDPSGQVRVLL